MIDQIRPATHSPKLQRYLARRSRFFFQPSQDSTPCLNGSHLLRLIVVVVLQVGASGCYCYRLNFVAFEDQPDVRVVERTLRVREYGSWTIWPIPSRYAVTRSEYTIELWTVIPHGNPPLLKIRAYTPDGAQLQLFADGRLRDPHWISWIGAEPRKGSISFDVLLEGERLGSETLHYEIQSRPFACEWDLP